MLVTRMVSSGLAPRRAALGILQAVREGGHFDAALERGVGDLPEADRRLAHELAAGVLRQRTALDQRLAPLVPRGWDSVAANLQDILRLGAYQLTTLNRIPAHAAVDTSVTLARNAGGARAGGFVNAVLRRLSSGESAGSEGPAGAAALARTYSHPEWLVQRWIDYFGKEETEVLLQWNNRRPHLVVQPARQGLDGLRQRWRAEGIEAEPASFGAGLVPNYSRPQELPGYREGDFIVQDPAQALLARFADFPSGATVYDACAAPGGKSIALGRSAATVLAGDVSRRRAQRLAENLARAGSGREHAVVADARQPPVRSVAAVLLDAPCLGTGTFARHPDARWRVLPEHLLQLQQLQAALLEAAAQVIEPGGLLVYSTCSLEPEENQRQVESFLRRHPDFRRAPAAEFPPPLLSSEGDLFITPQRHGMDGAYAARLRRES